MEYHGSFSGIRFKNAQWKRFRDTIQKCAIKAIKDERLRWFEARGSAMQAFPERDSGFRPQREPNGFS